MSPLMMLLSFMLPMLTAAIQTVNDDDLHTLFPADPKGDVLNITQCYCQSSAPLSHNATFGYAYLFNYWNYHLNTSFPMAINCTSAAPDNSFNKKPAECMKHINHLEKKCHTYHDGNKFCFKFKQDVNDSSGESSRSRYYFNKQERRVPGSPFYRPLILAPEDVSKDCDLYCHELGGLKTIERSSSLIPGFGPVTNNIASYPDLDDMCDDCA